MPRLDYLPQDITEPKQLVESIRKRRNGKLLNLDRMLLHSPPFAKGWNALLREVRESLSLPDRLRELVICAVAGINRAEYELHHHAPLFLAAGGSEQQLERLRRLDTNTDLSLFSLEEQAALQLTLEMTLQVEVSDACFADLCTKLPLPQQQLDLIALVSTYNMVSRYLVALQIMPESKTD